MQTNHDNLKYMSQEDIDQAKLRAVKDYQVCREQKSALENEARNKAKLLEGVREFLLGRDERFASGALEDDFSDKLIRLMNTLRETRQRYEVLRKTIQDLGIPIGD